MKYFLAGVAIAIVTQLAQAGAKEGLELTGTDHSIVDPRI